ncbi:hypothetical protein, partial [Actinocorallia lasiicapitis]
PREERMRSTRRSPDRPAPRLLDGLRLETDGDRTEVRLEIPFDRLLSAADGAGRRQTVLLYAEADGHLYEFPLSGASARTRRWHRFRPYDVVVAGEPRRPLVIKVQRVTLTRIAKRAVRELVHRKEQR